MNPEANADNNLPQPKLPYETPDNPWVAIEGSIPSDIMDIVRESIRRNRQEETEANWAYYEELERQEQMNDSATTQSSEQSTVNGTINAVLSPDQNSSASAKRPRREPIPNHPLASIAGSIDGETIDFIREEIRRNRQEEVEAIEAYDAEQAKRKKQEAQ